MAVVGLCRGGCRLKIADVIRSDRVETVGMSWMMPMKEVEVVVVFDSKAVNGPELSETYTV